MLALKTVLAAEDQIRVLVFDEVDANVGGETANAVGEKMQQIAQKRQVLCITHLPQVAAPASAHYVATKHLQAGRTVSEITRLDQKERVSELARMLAGQTEAARKHAEALLKARHQQALTSCRHRARCHVTAWLRLAVVDRVLIQPSMVIWFASRKLLESGAMAQPAIQSKLKRCPVRAVYEPLWH
jgi:hypothetical protein